MSSFSQLLDFYYNVSEILIIVVSIVYKFIEDESPNETDGCVITEEVNDQLTQFERTSMENFMRSEKRKASQNIDSQVPAISER